MSRQFERGDLVRVVKLNREKKKLGGFFLTEEQWLARREGVLGIIAGPNVTTNDVWFVMHHEEGEQSIAAYGTDEIEVVDDNATKLEFLQRTYRSRKHE